MAELRNGACHCGAIRFTVKLTGGLDEARRCNCSFCRMRGAVALTAMRGDLTITQGADIIALYQFNTKKAEHYFCPRCGIYTHHRRRSNGDELGVNAACLAGVSPFDFPVVPVNEGVLHPSDDPGGPKNAVAGYLRYEKARP